MSFLSLSRGDPQARDLLQRAIRARYGLRPLPLDSVRLWMTGKGTGPLGLFTTVTATVSLIPGSHWRWDQTSHLLGITTGIFTVTYDGGTCYERRGRLVTRASDPAIVQGARCRMWLECASMLTPLTTPDVTLKAVDERTFQAMPDPESNDAATIRLNADDTVSAVEASCYHAAQKCEKLLTIRPAGGLQTLDGFTVPRQIVYQWSGERPQRFNVIKAEANPKIPLTEFTLG
jgi:hypothetical protein